MDKLITFPGVSSTGEPLVQALFADTGDGKVKVASYSRLNPDIQKYVDSYKPKPGKLCVLVNALGAGEYYGSNCNADYFEEAELDPRQFKGLPVDVADPSLYGHQTFLRANVFRHHKNKDPGISYGQIVKVVYNEGMHRVELIIEIDRRRAEDLGYQDLLSELDAGGHPAVSMGARVKYDVCSICGNKSYTRKDYCFPPGTKISMADGRRKPIECVEVGEFVQSANGGVTRVVAPMRREVDECLVVLKTTVSGELLRLTGNHPVLSSPREAFSCYYAATSPGVRSCFPGSREECSGCRREEPTPDFVPAADVRAGDSVYSPALGVVADNRMGLDAKDAFVLGLFMAEGCYSKQGGRRSAVQFCLHKDETELIERVREHAEHAWGLGVKVYPAGENGISVRIHGDAPAEWYYQYCGEYAAQKAADQEIVDLPDPLVHTYLEGLWAGDGHVSTKKSGYSRLNSVSEDLIWQTAGLLRRLGYSCYVGCALNPGGPTARANTNTLWYVQTDFLTGQRRRRSSCRDGVETGYVKDVSREHYMGTVYNFETADNTYVAEGVGVHNCVHMKTMRNQVFPDGRKVFVYNPKPKFFDLSFVIIGADKTSYAMLKVAYAQEALQQGLSADAAAVAGTGRDFDRRILLQKMAEVQKKAEITKRIPSLAQNLSPSLTSREPDMGMDQLRELARHPIERTLTSTGAAGIVLKPAEFQTIVLIKMRRPDMARSMWDRGQCFAPEAGADMGMRWGSPRDYYPLITRVLSSILGRRSALGADPGVGRPRCIVRVVRPLESNTPLLTKVAEGYNGYRIQLLEKAPSLVSSVTSRDGDLLSTVFGEVLEGSLLGLEKSAGIPPELLTDTSLAYLYGAHHQEIGGLTKSASAVDEFVERHPVLAASLLLGLVRLGNQLHRTGKLGQLLHAGLAKLT